MSDSDGSPDPSPTRKSSSSPLMQSQQQQRQGEKPYDGVGVVVRVRPLSTLERADPSIHNCVQCLKDYVVVGGTGTVTDTRAPAVSMKPSSRSVPARPQQFQVDYVFHPHSSQIEVYEHSCRHIVEGAFQGVNGSIMAYGATGSGKTHTMFGGAMSAAGIVFQAVQDIFAEKSRLEEEEGKAVTVRCSFLEIYNEEVFDLLSGTSDGTDGSGGATEDGGSHRSGGGSANPRAAGASASGRSRGSSSPLSSRTSALSSSRSPSPPPPPPSQPTPTALSSSTTVATTTVAVAASSTAPTGHINGNGGKLKPPLRAAAKQPRTPLQVREVAQEDKARLTNPESLTVCGLRYVYPQSVDEFARYIDIGHVNRFVAATGANAQSSRSHAIITVEVVVRSNAACGEEGTVARIRFCDLAGSERAASTSNSGLRLREGGNINRSLLALGAVVQSLVQRRRHPGKQVFVPYRGSKLTRLLRDGIGGNCRTQMLFCLSPSTRQYEESVNTMLFAMQAKEIRVTAKRNEYNVNSAVLTQRHEQLIEELRAELAAARNELMRLGGGSFVDHGVRSGDKALLSTATVEASPKAANPTERGSRCSFEYSVSAVTVSPFGSGVLVPTAMNSAAAGPLDMPADQNRCQSHVAGSDEREMAGAMTTTENSGSAIGEPAGTHAAAAVYASLPPLLLSTSMSGPGSDVYSPQQIARRQPQEGAAPSPDVALSGIGELEMGTQDGIHRLPTSSRDSRSAGRLPSVNLSRPGRPSVFHEGSPMFTELETKLKSFTAEKESLYHQLRDAEELKLERDIKLREQKWKLAQFLASSAMNNRVRGSHGASPELTSGGTPVTPIGVAGLRQLITAMETESESQDEKLAELSAKLDSIDRQIAATRQELLREKQQASLELLLDNARLRQSCTEAECLAAHYHQECRTTLNREQEYAQALQACVGAIRAVLPMLPFNSTQREQAKVALLYASLPTASTAEMIPAFETALRAETTPPLAPHLTPAACGVIAGPAFSLTRADSAGSPCLPPMVPASPKKAGFTETASAPALMSHFSLHHGHETATREPSPPGLTCQSTAQPPWPNAPSLHPEALTDASAACEPAVDLEQHFRELLEAATCFKSLSPTCGRGRRHHTPTRSKAEEELGGEWARTQADSSDRLEGDVSLPQPTAAGAESTALVPYGEDPEAPPHTVSFTDAFSPGCADHEDPIAGPDGERGARFSRLAPPRVLGGARNAHTGRPSPYARTFSTFSFNAASRRHGAADGGSGGGGRASDKKRKANADGVTGKGKRGSPPVAAFARTHTTPVLTSAAAATSLSSHCLVNHHIAGTANRDPVRGRSATGLSSPLGSVSLIVDGERSDLLSNPQRFRRVETEPALMSSPRARTAAATRRTPAAAAGAGRWGTKGKRPCNTPSASSSSKRKGNEEGRGGMAAARGGPRAFAAGIASPTRNSNASGHGGGARKRLPEEASHSPTITPLPRHQRPHIFVRSNTAFTLRAGQASTGRSAASTASSSPRGSRLSSPAPGMSALSAPRASALPRGTQRAKFGQEKQHTRRKSDSTTSSNCGSSNVHADFSLIAFPPENDPHGSYEAVSTDGPTAQLSDLSDGGSDRCCVPEEDGAQSGSPGSGVPSADRATGIWSAAMDADSSEEAPPAAATTPSAPAASAAAAAAAGTASGKSKIAAGSLSCAAMAAAHCPSPTSAPRSGALSTVSSTTVTPHAWRRDPRKGSCVSTLTSAASQSAEEDLLLVSRSTCADGPGGEW